ncbi:MAG: flagellar biosynthetic protein FliO [Syntrophorhabdaceae bacterium]
METYLGIVKVILIMAGMIAGIYLLSRYAGKMSFKFKPKDAAGYGLRKVDTIYLGSRKFISVIEVRDRVIVIGAGEKEISVLAKWKKEEGNKE